MLKSEDNLIGNKSLTNWYNIKRLKQIMGEIYVNFIEIYMRGDYFTRLTGK